MTARPPVPSSLPADERGPDEDEEGRYFDMTPYMRSNDMAVTMWLPAQPQAWGRRRTVGDVQPVIWIMRGVEEPVQ